MIFRLPMTAMIAGERNSIFWLRQAGLARLERVECGGADELCGAPIPTRSFFDTELRGMSSFELANQLKSDPLTASIPIIHVAPGFTTGEWRAQGLDAGADAFLTRRLEPPELIATVRALLLCSCGRGRRACMAAERWEATFDAITDAGADHQSAWRDRVVQ